MKDSAIMGRESLIGRRTVGPADEGAKSHQAGNILFGQKLLQSKLYLFGSLRVVFPPSSATIKWKCIIENLYISVANWHKLGHDSYFMLKDLIKGTCLKAGLNLISHIC